MTMFNNSANVKTIASVGSAYIENVMLPNNFKLDQNGGGDIQSVRTSFNEVEATALEEVTHASGSYAEFLYNYAIIFNVHEIKVLVDTHLTQDPVLATFTVDGSGQFKYPVSVFLMAEGFDSQDPVLRYEIQAPQGFTSNMEDNLQLEFSDVEFEPSPEQVDEIVNNQDAVQVGNDPSDREALAHELLQEAIEYYVANTLIQDVSMLLPQRVVAESLNFVTDFPMDLMADVNE